ncbi:MAG: acetyltransferase [Benniella sp.]|nr:MAG: acetyltransferase [Benniella sp.]
MAEVTIHAAESREQSRPSLPPIEVTVRAAEPSDVKAILSLIHELAEYEKEPPSTVEATEESLLNTLRFTPPHPTSQNLASCLLAFIPSSNEPVGFALYFTNYSTWRGKGGIYLEDLFVKESARGQKIGKRLLGELAREVTEMDGRRLEWSVLTWNKPSIKFYESLGAVAMTEWQTMRVDGDALTKLAQNGPGIQGKSTTLM